jgi:hypothetical protein
VGIGASKMEGCHPWFAGDAPVMLVQATTGNATATSPFNGAVVVDPEEAEAARVVEVVPRSDVPHPVRPTLIRTRTAGAKSLGFIAHPPWARR